MRRVMLAVVVVLVAGCGASRTSRPSGGGEFTNLASEGGDGAPPAPGTSGKTGGEEGGGAMGPSGLSDGAAGSSSSSGSTTTTSAAGTLTAGTWDDNLNFSFFLSYLSTTKPAGFLDIPRGDRLVVHVADAQGAPVAGATVVVSQNGQALFTALSASDGAVYAFPGWDGASGPGALSVKATLGADSAVAPVAALAGDATLVLAATTAAPVDGLDIALVLDTTGSMGDELGWLKAEVESISTDVAARSPGVPQRWALVLYRDDGDAYVTQVTDFTSLAAFKTALSGASSGGGGDFPEAVHAAVDAASALSWSTGAKARLVFHVADAPQHANKVTELLAAVKKVRGKSVRYYPVAASGVDEVFEQSFRSLAEVTGGRYVFLTDDSGVGGAHKEPTLPCYVVTKLHEALVRMISMELSGVHLAPAPADILRSVGAPVSSECTLADGTKVTAL